MRLPTELSQRQRILLAGAALAVTFHAIIAASLLDKDLSLLDRLSLLVSLPHILVGLLLCDRRPDNRLGPLMIVFGASFALPSFGGSDSAPLWTVSQFYNSSAGLFLCILLAFPYGRLPDLPSKLLAIAVLGGNTAFDILAAVVIDPRQFGCPDCPRNLLLVSHQQGLAEFLVDDLAPLLAFNMSLTGVLLVIRFVRGAAPLRRALAPLLPLAAILSANNVIFVVRRVSVNFLDDDLTKIISLVSDLTLLLLPISIGVGVLRSRRSRQAKVGDLVMALADVPTADRLQGAVARALGDPSVLIGVWRDDVSTYIGADGLPLDPPAAGAALAATYLARSDGPLALVVHDEALLDDPGLLASVTAALRLAVDNDRLQEELLVQLEEVQASRARIVEAAFAERKRLERDLHDGAQQRLVSTALALQMARATVTDDGMRDQIDAVLAELRAAIVELRDLARGMYPTVLTDEGLAAALQSLADRSPVATRLMQAPAHRLAPAVEAAAYFVVAEALTNIAKYAGATCAEVTAVLDGPDLVVAVTDDGVGGAQLTDRGGLAGLRDRLAAFGGELEIDSRPATGTRLTARLPVATDVLRRPAEAVTLRP